MYVGVLPVYFYFNECSRLYCGKMRCICTQMVVYVSTLLVGGMVSYLLNGTGIHRHQGLLQPHPILFLSRTWPILLHQ